MLIPSQKHLFDIPDSHAYLNTAYMSPLMHKVVAAIEQGVRTKARPWTYNPKDFFTPVERLRTVAARIYGTDAQNIAIVPSVSYGIQIAANALPMEAGKHVLVLDEQFPSNVFPWQEKVKRCAGHVVTVPAPADHDWTAAVLDHITDETAILALPQTHWSTGATLDLVAIGKAARAVGATLALDLTQSLGAQPFDLKAVQPDFVMTATYKWLLGPYGLGCLYVAPRWHDAEPLEHNWINRAGSEDFTGLSRYSQDFQAGAVRFDMGEKSNPGPLMGAATAMEQILDWGIDNIAETLSAKTLHMANAVASNIITPVPQAMRAPHYLGLSFAGGKLEGLAERLSAQNMYVSVRGSTMRVTPHLYSTDEDIERFIAALADI